MPSSTPSNPFTNVSSSAPVLSTAPILAPYDTMAQSSNPMTAWAGRTGSGIGRWLENLVNPYAQASRDWNNSLGVYGQSVMSAAPGYQAQLAAGFNAPGRSNPYDAQRALQQQAPLTALYQQMRQTQAGPSVAGLQAGQAQGRALQQAVNRGGAGNLMQNTMSIGDQTGANVLAEQMRQSQGIGGLAQGLRGADLGVASGQAEAGMQTAQQNQGNRQFYGSQGAALERAMLQRQVQQYLMYQALMRQHNANQGAQIGQIAQGVGTVAGMAMGI